MKRTFYMILVAAATLFGAAACSSSSKMAEQAENVIVKCNPEVLEVVAGKVNATVTVTYPKGYFNSKAILKVTPVIVYQGGEAAGDVIVYQGEKVKDNYKVVSSDGATVTEKISIPYVKGMEKSYLELRGVASIKSKSVNLPSKKVADGANTTYMLVKKEGRVSLKADNYQDFISQTTEGQILYAINNADVRGSQLKGDSIKNFQAALEEIKSNQRKSLVSTEVVAYASPDGGESLNEKLSDKRARSAEAAWKKVAKNVNAEEHEVKSVGQDWEGFQELVAKSDIQDKDLILRVLSMYSDPAVRESEIKNMSEIYTDLKGEVLPELRRARFIANVEFQNYTASELKKLVDDNIDELDEEALLRAATLVKGADKKIDIYNTAVKKFDSDRARFNIGVVYLEEGDLAKAEKAFAKVTAQDGDLKNAQGVIALRKGDIAAAEAAFKAAGTPDSKANLGVVDILNGNYAQAAAELADAPGFEHNKVLAYILNGQIAQAEAAATSREASVSYLRAIIAARQNKNATAKEWLKRASVNDELRQRQLTDIEFAGLE